MILGIDVDAAPPGNESPGYKWNPAEAGWAATTTTLSIGKDKP